MPTKRTLDQIREREFLKMSELADLTGIRYSTIKFYSEMGLLPFDQKGPRLAKYYPRVEAVKRLKEIMQLRESGKSVTEIVVVLRNK